MRLGCILKGGSGPPHYRDSQAPFPHPCDKIASRPKRSCQTTAAMTLIRRIRIGEADLFKRMRLAALQEAPYAFSSTYDEALRRSDESWQNQADQTAWGADRATFISFSGNTPTGIAALYRIPDQTEVGELVQMWVAPAYRSKRVAWNLLDTLFEWASSNNFRAILARVTQGNDGALKFYSKYGFAFEEEMLLDDFDGVVLVRVVDSQPSRPTTPFEYLE